MSTLHTLTLHSRLIMSQLYGGPFRHWKHCQTGQGGVATWSHHNFTNLAGPSEISGYKIHLIKEALSVNKKCGRAEVDCT